MGLHPKLVEIERTRESRLTRSHYRDSAEDSRLQVVAPLALTVVVLDQP